MKKILGKKVELPEYSPISISLTQNEVWSCEKCKVLFEPEDTILSYSIGSIHKHYACPNKVKTYFGTRECRNHIYGGTRIWYESNYRIEQ
jgi:hypothetical protein